MLSTATNSCDESSDEESEEEIEFANDNEQQQQHHQFPVRRIFVLFMFSFIVTHMFFVVSWPRVSACATFIFISFFFDFKNQKSDVLIFVCAAFLHVYAMYERNLYIFFAVNTLHLLLPLSSTQQHVYTAALLTIVGSVSACVFCLSTTFFQRYYECLTIVFCCVQQVLFIRVLHANICRSSNRKQLLADTKTKSAQTFQKFAHTARQYFPTSVADEMLDDSQKKYIAYERANCSLLMVHVGGLDTLVPAQKSFEIFDFIIREFDAIVDFFGLEKIGTFHQYKYIVCEKLD